MKLEEKDITAIREKWATMLTKEDLLDLLNYTKQLIYGEKAVPFDLKQLTWYANPKINPKRYTEFIVKKKSGGSRTIHAPVKGLKAIQKTLSAILQCVSEPHKAAMGFVNGKSIVDNARLHEGQNYVYNIDLKDFFPSVDQARVWKCLQLKPFNLFDKEFQTREERWKTVETGVRTFATEFEETISYKLKKGVLLLIRDKKGNYSSYQKRLTSHLPRPDKFYQATSENTGQSAEPGKKLSLIDSIRNMAAEKLAVESNLSNQDANGSEKVGKESGISRLKAYTEYQKQVKEIVFEDAQRYIFTNENIAELNRLFPSRQLLANMIAALCCTELEVERQDQGGDWVKVKRNILPQGAPTSPVITNTVCQKLDHRLSGLAKRFGLKYSRYADDITFSSMHNVYQQDSDFIKELHRIISDQGFHINESKTRLQKEGYRQEVTGLLVNVKANVQKRYIKQLRMWLYYWERYGYERASSFFLQQYVDDKGQVKKGKPDMVNVISGKLDYLKMVRGSSDNVIENLKERFEKLIEKTDPISEILGFWENNGIEKAMEVYYRKK